LVRELLLDQLGDAEIEDLDHVGPPGLAGEEDVLRLEVAVDDLGDVPVDGADGIGDRGAHRDHEPQRQASLPPDARGQVLALQPLHHDEVQIAVAVLIDDLDDGRVRDGRRRPGLGQQPLDHRRVTGQLGVQHLHRQHPLGAQVLDLVDRPHATGTERRPHAVAVRDHPPGRQQLAGPPSQTSMPAASERHLAGPRAAVYQKASDASRPTDSW
jgi:hypothetical protein